MKVLWLAPLPYLKNPKGHPAPWIISLSQLLSRRIDLSIVVCTSAIQADETFEQDGIHYVYLKAPRGSIDLLTLHKYRVSLIRNYLVKHYKEYDLIHIHGSEHQFEQACWDLAIPKLLSVQGIISEYYKHIPTKFSFRRASWYLAKASEQTYLPYIKHFICRTDWDKHWVKTNVKDAVIHHCWETLRPVFFQANFDSTKNNRILFLGGTNDLKGGKEALIAFDRVCATKPNLKLTYVGPDEKLSHDYIQYIKSAHQLNNLTSNNVTVCGFLDGVGLTKAYSESYCLLHPSYIDNSPNSICEAQVAGLPVVASDVGGVSSLIRHNETGVLTSLQPDNIADNLLAIYSNKDFAGKIANQAKTEARDRHDPDAIQNDTYGIYHQVVHSFRNQGSLQAV